MRYGLPRGRARGLGPPLAQHPRSRNHALWTPRAPARGEAAGPFHSPFRSFPGHDASLSAALPVLMHVILELS